LFATSGKRFRQVLINAVMATDIADRAVIQARSKRWEKAFATSVDKEKVNGSKAMGREEMNRKATAVIENLIQVADVAHTMQHWNIYRRWNDRLFAEVYRAFMDGRASFDPLSIWFKGEIAFFDFFVIPLAKRLHDCGIFGETGNQYLQYAEQNRNEWNRNGEGILKAIVENSLVKDKELAVSDHIPVVNEVVAQIIGRLSNSEAETKSANIASDIDSTAPAMEMEPVTEEECSLGTDEEVRSEATQPLVEEAFHTLVSI
jgi:hypothetical protein